MKNITIFLIACMLTILYSCGSGAENGVTDNEADTTIKDSTTNGADTLQHDTTVKDPKVDSLQRH